MPRICPPNTCPICRSEILGEICGFHALNTVAPTWPVANKIWCGIIHRGDPWPKRVEKGLEDLTT